MSRYSPEPYKADGGFTIVGLPILFGILTVAAIILGGLAGLISQWFYLVLVFPMAIGFGLFGAGWLGNYVAKMRNVGIGFLAGLFASCVALGTMHFVEYRNTIEKVAQEARQNNPKMPPGEEQALRSISFPQYMNLAAKAGVTIGRRGGGLNLGYWGSWIYWSLELIGVAVLALIGTVGGAAQPFCPRCESWKDDKTLGHLTGDPEHAQKALEKGKIESLAHHEPGPSRGHLLLTMSHCKSCRHRSTIDVKLQRVTKNDKGEEEKSELAHVTYPGEAIDDFEELFGSARPRRRAALLDEETEDRPRRREDEDRPRRREVTDRPRDRDEDDRPRRRDRDEDEDRPRRAREEDRPRRPERDRDNRPRRRDDNY
jgi:hypothetical protein